MECNIYKDIEKRTNSDIYIGVVGPCRTGKSTFIKQFMDIMVLPNLENEYEKQRVIDELPQSGSGKTIMTTQPKFVPSEAVSVNLSDNAKLNLRLVDCVGYMVDGAIGHMEDDSPRMVNSPWSQDPIPFSKAAEIGTKKVILDHSTVGIVMTTDGSICDIDRQNYVDSENRAISELKELHKPFIIILNCTNPNSENAQNVKKQLEEKHNMPVLPIDVLKMSQSTIESILESILYEFPIKSINFNLPLWITALDKDHPILSNIMATIKENLGNISIMRDHKKMYDAICENEDFSSAKIDNIALGKGNIRYNLDADKKLFYKVIADECDYEIENDLHLMKILKELIFAKKQYSKVQKSISSAYDSGYGIISASLDEIELKQPEMIKQGNKYAVKLYANAPSIHLVRTDVSTEVCPIIGTEKQSGDVLNFLNDQFEANKDDIWQTNIFGKSLQEVVSEGLFSKNIPDESREKLVRAMQKLANNNKSHLICFVI